MKTERPCQAKRTILHVDMDAFFSVIELLYHPELQVKAVVVVGNSDNVKAVLFQLPCMRFGSMAFIQVWHCVMLLKYAQRLSFCRSTIGTMSESPKR